MLERARLLLALGDCHGSFKLNLSDEKLSVAELADETFRLLSIGIDATSWEHSLFVAAVFAVALSTELAKLNLRAILEDMIKAADAAASVLFFTIWPV